MRCNSCDFEENLSVTAISARPQLLNLDGLDAVFVFLPILVYPHTDVIPTGVETTPISLTIPTPPIYLQQLTLLC